MTGPRAGGRALLAAIAILLGPAPGCERARSQPSSANPPSSAPAPATSPARAPPASASAASARARALEGKVLVFGDSITHADWDGHIAPEEKWVTRLGTKSDRIAAVSAAKSGRTTQAAGELRAELSRHPDAHVVVFVLGVNDMKRADAGAAEAATLGMARLLDLTRAELPRAVVVLCAPPNIEPSRLTRFWRDEAGFGQGTFEQMQALAARYRTLAAEKGVRFVDLSAVVSPENLPDGVHPNGKGQIQIADAVWRELAGEG